MPEKDLFYLEELPDYEVASDYSDVRGWDVVDAIGRTVGRVTNLLVSKKNERTVYLDVEVDRDLLKAGYDTFQVPASTGVHGFTKDGEDHLIIPVNMVSLDEDRKKVLTDRIDYETFSSVRRFQKGAAIDPDYEVLVLRQYTGDDTIDATNLDARFYNRESGR